MNRLLDKVIDHLIAWGPGPAHQGAIIGIAVGVTLCYVAWLGIARVVYGAYSKMRQGRGD